MKDVLEQLGFTESEATIYLLLLKRGPLTAISLAKELKIHRRTIYDNLNILNNKGQIAIHIEEGTHYYSAINPEQLKQEAMAKVEAFDAILPRLKLFYEAPKSNPKVTMLKGSGATRMALYELEAAKGEICWMGGGFKFFGLEGKGQLKQMLLHILTEKKSRIIQPGRVLSRLFPRRKIRHLPKKYVTGSVFFVFDNIVFLGSLVNEELFIIRIEDSTLAATYRNYFTLIWNQAKP